MNSLVCTSNLVNLIELIVFNSKKMTLTDLLDFIAMLERFCVINRPRCILELILQESHNIEVMITGSAIHLSSNAW